MPVRRDIDAAGVNSYRIPPTGLMFRSTATDGPGSAAGRTVNIHLDDQALASLVAVIAEIDPDRILRVAAAIKEADTLAAKAVPRYQRDNYARRERRYRGGLTPFGRIRMLSDASRGPAPASNSSSNGKEPTTP